MLDISDFPTRHPYGLGLWQSRMEPILAGWIEELGVPVHRGREVVGFVQDGTGVGVEFADGGAEPAKFLVGADGGRSAIRKAAGIDFPGWDATRSNLIAEVQVAEEPPSGMRQDESGVHGLAVMADGRTYRVVTTEQRLGPAAEPTLADLGNALRAVYGTDFGVHSPTWISRFTDATRQAAAYRSGRVLLAGDAAHIHYPAGGQGIGLGIQDAVNLGWKLAQVVKGVSPESLLDTYQAERHPAAARALELSMAQTVLQRSDARTSALTRIVDELMPMNEPRTLLAARIHGLDIAYDLGEGHPLLGRRMPDLDLDTADGPTRVSTLLHDAEPILLDLGRTGPDRPRTMGRPGAAGRRPIRRCVGTAGPRRGGTSFGGADPPRWACRVGGRGNRRGADGRTRPLVRSLGSATAPPLEAMWPISRTAISMRDRAAMRGSCRTSCSWCSCSRSTSWSSPRGSSPGGGSRTRGASRSSRRSRR